MPRRADENLPARRREHDHDRARRARGELAGQAAAERRAQSTLAAGTEDDQGRSFLGGDLGKHFGRLADLDSTLCFEVVQASGALEQAVASLASLARAHAFVGALSPPGGDVPAGGDVGEH
jgi:hypothetical protein